MWKSKQLSAMANSSKFVPLGDLIYQDVQDAYFLPYYPTTYSKDSKFLNEDKYPFFDYPGLSFVVREILIPIRTLATMGNKIPTLTDRAPDNMQLHHWRKWLPGFPSPWLKSIDEGFADNLPIMTTGPMQCMAEKKHIVDPELHYRLLLKSTIPQIGAPTLPLVDKTDVTFPCMLKVDQSNNGFGNRRVNNLDELNTVLTEIRDKCGWDGNYILQEFISGNPETLGYSFYLFKSGEIHWLGVDSGLIGPDCEFIAAFVDWEKQQELKELAFKDFVLPMKNFLHNLGYFGMVNFELLVTDQSRYLIDLNCRVAGNTPSMIIAPFMAECGLTKSCQKLSQTFSHRREELFARANDLNERSHIGKVIVLSTADASDGCRSDIAVFAKTMQDLQLLSDKFAA